MIYRWTATLAAAAGLWLIIIVLEALGTRSWLGPVVERNLAERLDAGALFYTEIDRKGIDAR